MTATPDEIGVYLPLIVAVAVTLAMIIIHALAFIVTIHYVPRKQKLGQAARRFLRDVAIVAVTTFIMLAAHLVEIAVWALVFVALGEFPALASDEEGVLIGAIGVSGGTVENDRAVAQAGVSVVGVSDLPAHPWRT